jgi:hypothetical protein
MPIIYRVIKTVKRWSVSRSHFDPKASKFNKILYGYNCIFGLKKDSAFLFFQRWPNGNWTPGHNFTNTAVF